ncbi:MAG: hypothetical protein KDD56_04740 [Bdellovibrionales bacterium]|nr:hypothetical protein [Bdellovibrionales bacterium]
MCVSRKFKRSFSIILFVLVLLPLTNSFVLAQEEAGKDKRTFVFNPKEDSITGVKIDAGIVETFEIVFESKFRPDGSKYTEFLLETVITGVSPQFGLPGFPITPASGSFAIIPSGFMVVVSKGGEKPHGAVDKLPQFFCAYTGTANKMDCDIVHYEGGPNFPDFAKSPLIASSNKGPKQNVFLETSYFVSDLPDKKSAHFRLRVDVDKLLEGETLISDSLFIPTEEYLGVWFHHGAKFVNLKQDATTGRFTGFDSAIVGWYDTIKSNTVDYPGEVQCKDSSPSVFDFENLQHGEILSNQFSQYFTVTGSTILGEARKVVAFDSTKATVTPKKLGTPSVPTGPGKTDDNKPGHGNTESKGIILVVADVQDSNSDGIADGDWKPLTDGGLINFNFTNPIPVRSFVAINGGASKQDVYKVNNEFLKIPYLGENSVQTLSIDYPDNTSLESRVLSQLPISLYSVAGVDDLAICLDCLVTEKDACGVCNGPGKDQCNRCPGDTGFGTDPGICGCNQVPDQCNRCPGDPEFNVPPSKCGCGQVPDECDLCPNDPNYGTGKDACGLCGGNGQDACARCPGEANYGNPDCDPCEQGLPRDECGVCGGPGKDDCGLCPDEKGYNTKNECGICSNDPNFDKPCTDCPEGRDVCGVCGGNNDCCGTQDLTAQQMTIDGTLHFMVNNFNTLRRRYAHRASGSKQKDYIRDASNTVEAAMLSGWTATWGITTLQTFCEGADAACTEVSNESNLQQVMAAADTIKAEAEKMLNKLTKILGRNKPREEDRKIFKALNNHYITVETNVSNLPKVTQNCNLK